MPASPEKLPLASMDVAADKQRLLRQLFPEAFTETVDEKGVDAVAEKHPVQFICLDRALQGSDSIKVNTLETFRAAQPEIQFRTV